MRPPPGTSSPDRLLRHGLHAKALACAPLGNRFAGSRPTAVAYPIVRSEKNRDFRDPHFSCGCGPNRTVRPKPFRAKRPALRSLHSHAPRNFSARRLSPSRLRTRFAILLHSLHGPAASRRCEKAPENPRRRYSSPFRIRTINDYTGAGEVWDKSVQKRNVGHPSTPRPRLAIVCREPPARRARTMKKMIIASAARAALTARSPPRCDGRALVSGRQRLVGDHIVDV